MLAKADHAAAADGGTALIRAVDEGRTEAGDRGLFPSNYVKMQ